MLIVIGDVQLMLMLMCSGRCCHLQTQEKPSKSINLSEEDEARFHSHVLSMV